MKIPLPWRWWRKVSGPVSSARPVAQAVVPARPPTKWQAGLQWFRRRWRFLLTWGAVALCWVIPVVVLIVAGSIWLYTEGWLLWWFLGAFVTGIVGWLIARQAVRKRVVFPGPEVKPALDWPPVGVAAWQEVERLAEEAEGNPPPLDRWGEWERLFTRVIEAVARHYYPESSNPLLEVSLPRLLRVIELAACDVRKAVCDHIPLADKLTIGDFRRAQRLQTLLSQLYQVYRIATLVVNPLHGLGRVLRDMAVQGLQQTTADAMVRWAAGYIVRRTGYYAIMLYGGYVILEEEELLEHQTGRSVQDQSAASRLMALQAREPIRMVVVGRPGAGKSSVINAVAGRAVAPLNVPNRRAAPYCLEGEEGAPARVVIELPDLEFVSGKLPAWVSTELVGADLVILVVDATSGDFDLERAFVAKFRECFAAKPHLICPPLVVVATHADLLPSESVAKKRGFAWLGLFGSKAQEREPEARLREALGLLWGDALVVDCFRPPVAESVQARLRETLRRLEPLIHSVRVSRVRRSLQSFRFGRDVVRPLVRMVKSGASFLFGGRSKPKAIGKSEQLLERQEPSADR